MPNPTNIFRNQLTTVVSGATGTGTSFSALFQKIFEATGAPGVLQLGLANVVGSFSGLQFNVEWSAIASPSYFEVIGTWTPLASGVGFFPISESGYYRLNCTTFTGGTSVDVVATIGLPSSPASSSSSSSNVTLVGSTITLPVSIASPVAVDLSDGSGNAISSTGGSLNVNVTGGGSSGTQYADGAAVATPTGTAALGFDGTDVWALRLDASKNLYVNLHTAIPAGSALIGGVEIYDGAGTNKLAVNSSGFITVANTSFAATQSGTWTVGISASQTIAVTNTGTFAVQASIDASQTIAVTNVGTFAVQDTVLDAALIAQEATTSGVKGLTVFGAVTTSAPSYTTAKSDALSLDTSGNLRVVLNPETTKIIGTINVAASQTIAVTNAGTFAVQASIAASQTIAVTNVGTFAVQATLNAETTKVIGTTRTVGNVGGVFDAVQGATAPANVLSTGGVYNTSLPTISNGDISAIQIDAKGQQLIDLNYVLGALHSKTNPLFTAITDGTNVITAAISAYGTAPTGTEVMGVNAFITNTALVNPVPATSGGLSSAVSQALTTKINVKASAGQLYGYAVSNTNASAVWLMYYNTATTPGTIGSTTNLIFSVSIPAGATANMTFPYGLAASSGIAVAVATTATGSTAPGTGLTITTFYN